MKINPRIYQLFPYLALFIFVAFFIIRLLIIFSDGNDIAGVEQNVIYSIQVLLNHGKLYSTPSLAPFSITQYTPLYYYICEYTAKLFSKGSDDIYSLYIIGRSWNLIFNVVTALIVYKIGRSFFSLSINKCYFLLLLSFTLNLSHNFAVRPDSLQDMISITSIYCFLIYLVKPGMPLRSTLLLLITVILTALSVFSKQSGIQLIIMFSGFCVLNGDWKGLIKLVIFSVIIYTGILFLWNYSYDSFFANVIGGIANGFNLESLIYVHRKGLFILITLPIILISLSLMIRKNVLFKGLPIDRLLAVLTLGSLIFASVTALKMGSTAQYYILFINLSLLLLMNELQSGQNKPSLDSPFLSIKEASFYFYLIMATLLCGAYNGKLILTFDHNADIKKQRSAALSVADYIKHDGGKMNGKYIFANLTNDYTIPSRQGLNNIFFRNCLLPQMDIIETSKEPSKVVGYKKFEDMIRNGQVEYIIESEPILRFIVLKDLESIKKTRFKLVKNIEGYLIYKFSPN